MADKKKLPDPSAPHRVISNLIEQIERNCPQLKGSVLPEIENLRNALIKAMQGKGGNK